MREMLELHRAFGDIRYYDDVHEYRHVSNDITFKSCTRIIGGFSEEFDEDHHSRRIAEKRGISQEEVLAEWKAKNLASTIRGHAIHSYMETSIYRKEMASDIDPHTKALCSQIADSLYSEGIIPIRTELVVYDEEFGVAGSMDLLAYNTVLNHFVVIDWKTNAGKDLTPEAPHFGRFLKYPIMQHKAIKYNEYSLQVSIYKWIIEKHCPSIKINELRLYHIDSSGWKMIEATDMSKSVRAVLKQDYDSRFKNVKRPIPYKPCIGTDVANIRVNPFN